MSGKYFVDVSKMNDVSKLLWMLSGYTKNNWNLPSNYLFINIENLSVFKSTVRPTEDCYVDAYKRVGYDEMIDILSKQLKEDEHFKDLGDHAKNSLGKIYNTIQKAASDDVKELLDKIRSSTFEELDARATKAHEKETLKQNLEILNDYLKNGTKIQFNISGAQWHNVTGKFKLEQLKHKSMKLRYKPECVEVDGVMMKPDAAIKYINKHYIKHYSTEVDGDKH